MAIGAAGDKTGAGSTVRSGDLEVIVSTLDGAAEVRLVGELDLATAGLLQDQLARLAADGPTLVTVDMARLAFIDSTGLSVLITALKQLRQQNSDLALRSPTPSTRKVLEITGLTEVFSIS